MKPAIIIIFFLLSSSLNTGCLEDVIKTETVYEEQPVKISYDVSYGYIINCTGRGAYEISYQCDMVKVLQGIVTSITILHPYDYKHEYIGDNHRVSWSIKGSDQRVYTLGVNASVTQESVIVDLKDEKALSINNIKNYHYDLVEQYCRNLVINDISYVDTSNSDILNTARSIADRVPDGNAFTTAKELFKWLKSNTRYTTHDDKPGIQPVAITYNTRKGDCDDLSLLYITLCRSVGIPSRLIRGYIINLNEQNAIPHAWVEVFVGDVSYNGWIPVECAGVSSNIQAEVDQHFGVEDVTHLRCYVDNGGNESLTFLLNDISFTYTSGVEIKPEPFIKIKNLNILESKQLVITKDGGRSYK